MKIPGISLTKMLVKKILRWDERSYFEKTVVYYRIKSGFATAICLLPLPIDTLFWLFGSDKEQKGGHHYGSMYRFFLQRLRYRWIKILEIGIGGYDREAGGQSLLAWKAFFPFAIIVACDIAPKLELATWRIRVYALDQSAATDLDHLVAEQGPFDVVIDDGSHLSAHQVLTFTKLFDAVADNGIYIVEDVQTSFWDGKVNKMTWDGRHISDPEFSRTCMGYFLELSKHINYQEFLYNEGIDEGHVQFARKIKRISFEHNLIVVEKGRNDTPSNVLSKIESSSATSRA